MTHYAEKMDYKKIARDVIRILQDGHLFDAPHLKPHHDNCPDAPHPLCQNSKHVLPLRDESRHHQRVTLEPEALAEVLNQRGLTSATNSLKTAPAEVKIIISLLLNVPITFSGEAQPRRERTGFENPLLTGDRFDDLAVQLDVDSEQLYAELEGAPAEMLGIIMIIADNAKYHVTRNDISDNPEDADYLNHADSQRA